MGLGCSWYVRFLIMCGFFWRIAFLDQQGFLSLYCGGTSNFTDSSNILWIPDSSYITTGNASSVNSIEGITPCPFPLRFFPSSKPKSLNCYRLPVQNMSLVLVRPQFIYKNYDGLMNPPSFFVSLGTAIVTTVNLTVYDPWVEEFVWPVSKENLLFCLHPIPGGGHPVISSLELRPLPTGAYASGIGNSSNSLLRKRFRINCGYSNGSLRYPVDPYDRIWDPDQNYSPAHLSAGFSIPIQLDILELKESPPVRVLQSARVLARKNILSYDFSVGSLGDYYIVMYFAGTLPVSSTFDVLVDSEVVRSNYQVKNMEASAVFISRNRINTLNITLRNISYYPQMNAIEIYEIIEIPMESSATQVSALQVIQQSAGFNLGWEGDPCYPVPWEHIGCEENLVTSLEISDMDMRVISPTFSDLIYLKTLDLHNTSLSGEIKNLGSLQKLEILNLSFNKLTSFGSDLIKLVSLKFLDLQNNSLQGTVPESMGSIANLQLLNLANNQLQGPLPQSLNKDSLEVRTSGDLCLSFSTSTCNAPSEQPSIQIPQMTDFNMKKHHGYYRRVIIAGSVAGGLCVLLVIALATFILRKRRREEEVASRTVAERNLRNWNATTIYSYKDIKLATNNFKDVIGSGSFGSVYLGKLSDGKLVAVKVRSDQTQLGADSFVNEVYILSQIRHQNLVSLEGFCHESQRQILVYEYLPSGSLADILYGSKSKKTTLNWARRIKIAVDSAKGLDYLHNGNSPRIIHRDVKCSNILLDLEMNAKVSDFGLSKQLPQADNTHVTTAVKGTAGYLDPEYYYTQQLNEKSDIYSFGVVLLELICGREPLCHAGTPDSYNLVLWAKPYLQAGAFEIVDESLVGDFDVESMRKAACIAVRCVERDASQRPTIAEVLVELKESYNIQLQYLASQGHSN